MSAKSYRVKKAKPDLKESKVIRELRKQVIKLKRENAALKKKNVRIENDYAEYQAEAEMEEQNSLIDLQVLSNTKPADLDECPSCGAYEVSTFTAGPHRFFKCGSCNTKGRIVE